MDIYLGYLQKSVKKCLNAYQMLAKACSTILILLKSYMKKQKSALNKRNLFIPWQYLQCRCILSDRNCQYLLHSARFFYFTLFPLHEYKHFLHLYWRVLGRENEAGTSESKISSSTSRQWYPNSKTRYGNRENDVTCTLQYHCIDSILTTL